MAGVLLALIVAAGSPAGGETRAPAHAKPLATCFWEGPISTKRPSTRGFDGRNFNFPEESATYWLARFNLPEGAELTLTGRYPYGRYMSLNAYSGGVPTDALSDIAVRADPRSTNPFVAGHLRDRRRRSWTLTVLDAPVPAAAREPNTLYAQPSGDAPIELLYRVYEPDPGRDLTGGTGLPAARLRLADGSELDPAGTCERIKDPNREITVQTVPAAVWKGARSAPGCDPQTNPAYDPIRWERFFNIDYASLAVISDCTAAGRQARLEMGGDLKGGFYSNRDSAYIYAHLSRLFGPVVVVNGRLPRFPRTYTQPRRMPDAELRYWSLCTGESRVTTRTPDCLADRQVLERSGRNYTIAVSTGADRPANARARCGVAWLDWGDAGDGAGDPNYGVLVMRNMLVSPGYERAIQRVTKPGDEPAVMGSRFPRASYTTTAEFEQRGCQAEAG
ncbi:MAG: hypothetical protein QOI10_1575 [Solirubrobacterales bacterium]|nr:hypothetical protein [Solirubrobacterales bacterium]